MSKYISSKIFYVFLFLFPLSSFAQLTANFSVSDSIICEGDTVDFTDLTTGGLPNIWAWSFTGAIPNLSLLQNPVDIVYPTAGVYDVLLGVYTFFPADTDTVFVPGLITVNVCASPLSANFSIEQDPICAGEPIDFTDGSTGTGINSWTWSFEGGTPVSSSIASPANIVFSTSGSYDIVLEISDGVITDDTLVTITVTDCVEATVADFSISQTTFCAGDTLEFTDESTGAIEFWNWNFAGAAPLNSTQQNPIFIVYANAGNFNITLIVTDSSGVSNTLITPITVGSCALELAIAASATTICIGECIDFTDESTGGSIDSYLWNFEGAEIDNSVSPNPTGICYNSPGTYDVILTAISNDLPITRTFTNYITVSDTCGIPFANFDFEPIVCQGSCVTYNNTSSNGAEYLWTFTGATPSTSTLENPSNICYNQTGSYTVTLLVTNGSFTDSLTQTINVILGPSINAGPDLSINQGASVNLSAIITGGDGTGDFEWQPFEEVSPNFYSQNVSVSPNETTLFIVSYQEEGSCIIFDEVNIVVSFVASLGVPSAFSPNKDGVNDELRILGEGISKVDFKIFNRYGQLVFETDNKDRGWNGRQNDVDLNPGVFAYYAKVTYLDGNTSVLKGNVTLVR